MPYSNSHSYIFVAIPKTGTTSTVSTLKKIHKAHRGKLLLANGEVDRKFVKKYKFDEALKGKTRRIKHLSALQLKYILGEKYNQYFSFTLVRNPWARTVSQYHYSHVDFMPNKAKIAKTKPNRKFHELSFDKWIKNRWKSWLKNNTPYRSQRSMISDKYQRVIIDYVGKLETIQDSLDHVCEQVGIPSQNVEHVNKTKKIHYSEMYTDELRDMVHEMCFEDIEHFNYRFENKRSSQKTL